MRCDGAVIVVVLPQIPCAMAYRAVWSATIASRVSLQVKDHDSPSDSERNLIQLLHLRLSARCLQNELGSARERVQGGIAAARSHRSQTLDLAMGPPLPVSGRLPLPVALTPFLESGPTGQGGHRLSGPQGQDRSKLIASPSASRVFALLNHAIRPRPLGP